MIPLPVILVEFMIAFGLALSLASTVALVRLRRDGNWPPVSTGDGPAPSRARILTGMVVGDVVVLWAVATWISKGYHF